MSHTDEDAAPLDELTPTLKVLTPIRAHRLSMAEHAWQRHRAVLDAMAHRLSQMADELQDSRDAVRETLLEQRELHAGRPLSLADMNRWLAAEQVALQQIARAEQAYKTLQAQYRQQQQWTDDSQRQLRRRQRDMEKLDYLRGLAQEAS